MAYDPCFDAEENKTLIAICTRKLISQIGLAGVAWGAIAIISALAYIGENILNLGLVIIGIIMLGSGLWALIRPSLQILLIETMVAGLVFCWNLGVAVLHYLSQGFFDPFSVLVPLIVAVGIAIYYRRLGHLRRQIDSVTSAQIKAAKQICAQLIKLKLKKESSILETKNRKCRVQLKADSAFFIQRNLMRAFVVTKEDLVPILVNPRAKRLQLNFTHPLGKLKYKFDGKNSQKLQNWLGLKTDEVAEGSSALG